MFVSRIIDCQARCSERSKHYTPTSCIISAIINSKRSGARWPTHRILVRTRLEKKNTSHMDSRKHYLFYPPRQHACSHRPQILNLIQSMEKSFQHIIMSYAREILPMYCHNVFFFFNTSRVSPLVGYCCQKPWQPPMEKSCGKFAGARAGNSGKQPFDAGGKSNLKMESHRPAPSPKPPYGLLLTDKYSHLGDCI